MSFASQFCGSVFHISLHRGESRSKDPAKCHIVMSKDLISIISPDWKTSLFQISPAAFISVTKKENDVILKFKHEQKATSVLIETNKPDKIINALTVETTKPTQQPACLAVNKLLPTYQNLKSNLQQLNDAITGLSQQLLALFTSQKTYVHHFADMLHSLYRLRFDESSSVRIQENIEVLSLELKRQLLVMWCSAISKASRFQIEPNAFEYFIRIIVNSSSDMATIAESIGANFTDLFTSVAHMSETGDAGSILPSLEHVKAESMTILNQSRSRVPVAYPQLYTLILNASLVALSGQIVQLFQIDIERLSTLAIDFARAAINRQINNESFEEMKKGIEIMANEMLRLLDAKRYDPEFHYVYCSFVIMDEIKNMKYSE